VDEFNYQDELQKEDLIKGYGFHQSMTAYVEDMRGVKNYSLNIAEDAIVPEVTRPSSANSRQTNNGETFGIVCMYVYLQ